MKTILLFEYTVLVILILTIIYFIVKDIINSPKDNKLWLRYGAGAVFAIFLFFIYFTGKKIINYDQSNQLQQTYQTIDKTEILISSIAEIESGGDTNAKNANSSASGHLQILEVLIKEVNTIDTTKHFTLKDRFNKEKSEEIFRLIQSKYNQKGDIEKAIRVWNGGPSYTVKSTQDYYEKVMGVYNRKTDSCLTIIAKNYKSSNL